MTDALPLRCACGAVRGELSDAEPQNGNHIVCYCTSCQAFAAYLGPAIVDGQGGTELFQTWPSRIRIQTGHEHLRAVRLSDQGMVRWYADCCRTPIGNVMPWRRPPFIGLFVRFVDAEPSVRDARFGPILGYTNGPEAKGGCPPHAQGVPWRLIGRGVRVVGGSLLAGGHGPSPFQKGPGGPWIVEPQVLSPDERAALAPKGP